MSAGDRDRDSVQKLHFKQEKWAEDLQFFNNCAVKSLKCLERDLCISPSTANDIE